MLGVVLLPYLELGRYNLPTQPKAAPTPATATNLDPSSPPQLQCRAIGGALAREQR